MAGGGTGSRHDNIATHHGLTLLYDFRVGYGAHDSGFLEIDETRKGLRLFLYGLSASLSCFGEDNKGIVKPDYSSGNYDRAYKKYLAALEQQRQQTCEAIAPLFLACVNNPSELLWTVEGYQEKPTLKKFTRFRLV